MLRKTMLVVLALMLAGLSAPAQDAPRPILNKDYRAMSYEESKFYIAAAMQGVASAAEGIGDPTVGMGHCPIDIDALMAEIAGVNLRHEPDDTPFQGTVAGAWGWACGRGKPVEFAEPRTDTYADYQAWPEPLQTRYVVAAMDGILSGVNGSRKLPERFSAAFGACWAEQPAVSAALARVTGTADGGTPMADLVFAAYEAACRETDTPPSAAALEAERLRRQDPPSQYREVLNLDKLYWGGKKETSFLHWIGWKPSRRTVNAYKHYKTWPEAQQVLHVRGVMEGIQGTFVTNKGGWGTWNYRAFTGCWPDPDALRLAIPKRYDASYDILSFRLLVWTEFREGCLRKRYPKDAAGLTRHAAFKAWPAAQQDPYVEAVIAGIEVSIHEVDGAFSADNDRSLNLCTPDPSDLKVRAAAMADGKAGAPPMGALLYRAYVAACGVKPFGGER